MIDYHARPFQHDHQAGAYSEPVARCFDLEPGALRNLCKYQVNKLTLMLCCVPESGANRCKQQEHSTRKGAKKFHTVIGLASAHNGNGPMAEGQLPSATWSCTLSVQAARCLLRSA